jgi:16S rRNA (guanine966-N2)-methyltransferase
MRVIAGRLRGRRLRAPRGAHVRPTSDRVREATFAMLASVEGAVVLDLFAGTGALGIEALSRGAARVTFVERDRAVAGVLRENLDALQLGPDLAQIRVCDALQALQAARERDEKYDLIFIDPPYRGAGAWSGKLAEALPPLLAPDARIVVESDRRAPLELDGALERDRRYGDTSIRIHRHT